MSTLRSLVEKHEDRILRAAFDEYAGELSAECGAHGLISRAATIALKGYWTACIRCLLEEARNGMALTEKEDDSENQHGISK